jgi:sugar phosphate isomerase/epimerase
MDLLIFRSLWGMEGPLEEQVARIADAGYDGVEAYVGSISIAPAQFASLVASHGLKLIMQALLPTRSDIEPTLKRLAEFGPLKIDAHTGRDSMSKDDGCAIFEEALRVQEQIGIPVGHETHRGEILFNPWATAYYLKQFPTLKVVADYSHWVNVCERLPDDQAEAIDLANQRALHIHARVGYEEGPQVPDPSAPEYGYHLVWHEKQWAEIRQYQEQYGEAVFTMTPEYGSPRYLHTLPHTDVPVADLWSVCLWGAQRARQQWNAAL